MTDATPVQLHPLLGAVLLLVVVGLVLLAVGIDVVERRRLRRRWRG